MSQQNDGARRRAGVAAALLLLAGGLSGVLVDRLWLLPRPLEAMPLTAQAMAARLDLSTEDAARVRALLDTMHVEVTAAAQQGSDSLVATARNAHLRLEAALPPDARPEFRVWLHEHHLRMMERMDDGRTHGPGHVRPGGAQHNGH